MSTNDYVKALKIVLDNQAGREIVAEMIKNPNCPPETLKMIVERENVDDITRTAVKHPNCPSEVLKKILEGVDNDWVCRLRAAENPNCTPETFEMLFSRYDSELVLRNAIRNPSCPIEILMKVYKRNDFLSPYVRENVHRFPECREITDPQCHPEKLKAVFDRKISKVDLMDYEDMICERDYTWETIEHDFFDAASNPNCPSETLKMILERDNKAYAKSYFDDDENEDDEDECDYDPDLNYRIILIDFLNMLSRYAAGNPNCPPETLKSIVQKKVDKKIVFEAVMNPSCPVEVFNDAFKELKNGEISWGKDFYCKLVLSPSCPVEILEEILCSESNNELTRCAAKNPKCPSELLKMIIKRGKNDEVTWNAIMNENCPDEILQGIIDSGKDRKGFVHTYYLAVRSLSFKKFENVLDEVRKKRSN